MYTKTVILPLETFKEIIFFFFFQCLVVLKILTKIYFSLKDVSLGFSFNLRHKYLLFFTPNTYTRRKKLVNYVLLKVAFYIVLISECLFYLIILIFKNIQSLSLFLYISHLYFLLIVPEIIFSLALFP